MSETQGATEAELDGPEYVRCEVCGLPHRRKAERCDRCDHVLGSPADWVALEAELPSLRRQLAAGVLVSIVMIGLNLALFAGAGAVVALAPITWALYSGYRIHVVSGVLRHRNDGASPR